MKLRPQSENPSSRARIDRRSERGIATIIVLAILSVAIFYTAANARSLNRLSRQLKQLEQKQVQRLNGASATHNAGQVPLTNALPSALPTASSAPD